MATLIEPTGVREPELVGWGAEFHAEQERYVNDVRTWVKERFAGPHTGEIIRFQVADGYAEYMVAQLRPLRLVHLKTMDAYRVLPSTIRGLRSSDAEDMLAWERRMAQHVGRS